MDKLPKFVQRILLLLLTALLLFCIAGVVNRMNAIREIEGLTDTSIPENAPPVVAFTTVALGSFRGLVADFLWLRSEKAKDDGNYFEMVQLASWIVKLQPRFTEATAYLAWNMSYNVSVTFQDFEDRWRWVQRGIELIRDEALAYNPGDPVLFKELGWIYQHKLGEEMDDANRYYKVQLAKDMMNVLGGWPVDWKELAAAPPNPAALFEQLGDESTAELKRILTERDLGLAGLEAAFRETSSFPEDLAPVLAEADLARPIELYFRQRWLKQVKKLDAGLILEINQRYGDLDWRLPEAHALYWATRGMQAAEGEINLACERMIFQSLANAYRGGRMILVEESNIMEITPNLNIVDAVSEQYEETIERHSENVGVRSGYQNFLIDATVNLYIFGRTDKAAEYFKKLRGKYPSARNRVPLNRFVLRELAGDIQNATFDQGQSIVQGYLIQMYQALALGDVERGEALEGLARDIWKRYMQDASGSDERRALPPYNQMKKNMYERCQNTFSPVMRQRLTQAARAYGALPEE